jgi:hypothetical protein
LEKLAAGEQSPAAFLSPGEKRKDPGCRGDPGLAGI